METGNRLPFMRTPTITPAAPVQPSAVIPSSSPMSISLPSDSFERRVDSPATAAADKSKVLFNNLSGKSRRQFWSDVVASNLKLNGIQPVMQPEWSTRNINSFQPQAVNLVQDIRALSPEQKVDFMRQMTGDNSIYTRYVDTVLQSQQAPSAKDIRDLFKPEVNNWLDPGAIQSGFSTMAIGLMMLPIVLPTMAIAQPNALAAIAGQIALSLL